MAGEIDRRFRTTSRVDLRNTKPRRQVEGFRVGEVLTAKKLSRLSDAVNRTTSLGSPRTGNGFRDRVTGIFEATVLEEHDDFLVCRLFPLSSNPEDIAVAKPFTLRRHPIEAAGRGSATFVYGEPGQRTASFVDEVSGEEITSEQYIVPPYLPGDVIYCSNQIVGGVALFAGTFELHGSATAPEHFIDLNIDGRQWAAEVVAEPPIEISTDVETA